MDRHDLLLNVFMAAAALALTVLLLEGFFRIYLGDNLDYRYVNDTWLLEPNQTGFTAPNDREATINRYGFRGDYTPGNNTVVVLGDSFTFGYCLRDNQTFLHRLEQVLRQRYGCDIETVNAGVPGYGVWQMIDLYNRRFQDYPADHVVLTVIEQDLRRQPTGNPYEDRKSIVRRLIRSSSFIAFMKPRLELFRDIVTGKTRLDDERDEFLQRDQERITAFDQELQERNKTLILHVWVNNRTRHQDFYQEMKQFADDNSIPFIANHYPEAVAAYDGNRENLYCSDGHPSALQTRRVADATADQYHRLLQDACQAPGQD